MVGICRPRNTFFHFDELMAVRDSRYSYRPLVGARLSHRKISRSRSASASTAQFSAYVAQISSCEGTDLDFFIVAWVVVVGFGSGA